MKVVHVRVPVSPEQGDVIIDHLAYEAELGVQPDERIWMVAQAQKLHPSCKVLSADLNLGEAAWELTLEINE